MNRDKTTKNFKKALAWSVAKGLCTVGIGVLFGHALVLYFR